MLTKNVNVHNMILARHGGTCFNPIIQDIEAEGLRVYASLTYTMCLRPVSVI